MKKLSLIMMLLIAYSICAAQTVSVSGNVKDEQGNPVHYAFVKNDKLTSATYTDTLGNFSLVTQPGAKITIAGNGYSDVVTDAGSNVQVVLKGNGPTKPVLQGDAKTMQDAFLNLNTGNVSTGFGFGGVLVSSDSKQIVGHRFLFTTWVHGYMVKADGTITQNPDYLFNYDKMKGDLFIAAGLNTVTLGDNNIVKSFTLFDHDQAYTFEKMTGISTDLFSRVLSGGGKYKIYKLTTTKFVKANFHTNGISSSGNNYDEFADDDSYYIQNVKTGNFQPLALKKKAIKAAFPGDVAKLNAFMTAHSGDTIDDDYLKNLGDALNQ